MKIDDLILKHYQSGELYRIAYKMTKCEDRAQDLLHSSVVRMLQNKSKYENRNFLGFAKVAMFRILINSKRNIETKKRKEELFTKSLIDTNSFINKVHYKKMFDDLKDCLDDELKSIIDFKLEGHTHAEISSYLKIRKNVIDGRIQKIKRIASRKYKKPIL